MLPHPISGERLIGIKQSLYLNSLVGLGNLSVAELVRSPFKKGPLWRQLTYTAPYEFLGCCVNTRCRTERSRGELMQQGRKFHPFNAFRLSYFHPSVATESSRKDKASIRTLNCRSSWSFRGILNSAMDCIHDMYVNHICGLGYASTFTPQVFLPKHWATTKQRSETCG